MQMHESEQWEQPGSEWQASREDSGYRAGDLGRYEQGQLQKIYPQETLRPEGKVFGIATVILSSCVFLLAVAGTIASAIVLQQYIATINQDAIVAAGAIGLISSLGVMLLCVAIFVMAVVTLRRQARGKRV